MEFLADLHPKIVHFPITLIITSVLFDILGIVIKKESYERSAHLLLFLGVVGSFAAVLSGNQAFIAYEFWNEDSSKILEDHEFFANITIWYFTALLILRTYLVIRKKYFIKFKYLIVVFGLIGCFFVIQTSEYGGQLVKKFGIGTEVELDQHKKNE
ncbi:DUF2231 domain-containing protein [Bacteroidota bacterium]